MAICNTQSLSDLAACFSCLPPGMQQILKDQLLCELIAIVKNLPTTIPQQVYTSSGNPNGVVLVNTTLPCICLDTLNAVTWQKTDGVISSTGWSGP